MNEEEFSEDAETLREETAQESPELQEHDRVAELEALLEEEKKKSLYAAADVQNARRRMESELADAKKYGATALARDMLAVRDNLTRALDHVPGEAREGRAANFIEGIEATLREIDAIFTRNGVEKVETIGQPLDPNVHQAMVEIPSEEAEAGSIVEEMQTGYTIRGRLLRPALVGVAKAP